MRQTQQAAAALAGLLLACAGAVCGATVEIRGAQEFQPDALDKHLQERIPALFETPSPAVADDAAFVLRRHYDLHGFPDARVDFAYGPQSTILMVTEGPRVTISELAFPPDLPIPESTLRPIAEFNLTPGKRKGGAGIPFSSTNIKKSAKALQASFAAQGYLTATTEPVVEEVTHLERRVRYLIVPGPKYALAAEDLQLSGSGVDEAALRAELASLLTETFRASTPERMRSRLLDYFRRNGHEQVHVKVEQTADPVSGRVQVHLFIESGAVYRYGEFQFEGEGGTSTARIQRLTRLKPGGQYNAYEVDAALQRLLLTGAFDDVSVRADPISPDELRLTWSLKEKKSQTVSVTGGYGTWDGPYTKLEYTESNLFGSLRRLKAAAYASARGYTSELELRDPDVGIPRMPVTYRLFASQRELPGFELNEYGGSIRADRRMSETFRLSLEVGLRKVLDTSSQIVEIPPPPAEYTLPTAAIIARFDHSDSEAVPTKGYTSEIQVQTTIPSLGDLEFVKLSGNGGLFVELGPKDKWKKRPMLVFHGAAGTYLNSSISEMPYQERFYLGGDSSVRSFRQDELGPEDRHGTPTGGLSYFVVNAEFLVPIVGPLYFATFGDMGSLSQEAALVENADPRYAVGAGLRVRTPLGAIRFDYGYNPDRRENEAMGAFHFGVGFKF